MDKEVAIPKPAKEKLQNIYQNMIKIQGDFQIYASAVKDTLGLDGECNLDTNRWIFTPKEKKDATSEEKEKGR